MQLRRGQLGRATLAVAALAATPVLAQNDPVPYTDSATGITFSTWQGESGAPYTFGMVLPPNATTVDATEYIGYLKCTMASPTETGWCGVSHGQSGQMTQSLLLMAWPYNGEVLTSFRFATGYTLPGVYSGNAKLTQISSSVNGSTYEVLYRCEGCFAWDHQGAEGRVSTTAGFFVMGRAQARASVGNAHCPNQISFGYHNNGFGQWGAPLTSVGNPNYWTWAARATKTVAGYCNGAPPTTATPTTSVVSSPTSEVVAAPTTPAAPARPTSNPDCKSTSKTFDYIIAGAGAGGIPIADRLSRAGKSVLLIEKGPPSTSRWGGFMKPEWLEGEPLTRFDVPGLCNQIWVDSVGVACTDTDQMAGCVLGGGTAVNAGLWWKPNPQDWDYNFPEGWHAEDTKEATERVFTRIPGTTVPSQDGKMYLDEGFNILSNALAKGGWKRLDEPNRYPTMKNHTFGKTTYMFSGGERGGPLATYLVTAAQRRSFTLWTDTAVKRVTRIGGHITGVEVESTGPLGHCGSVRVNSVQGRVIISAGTFGSAKLLLRSGIGPKDQLAVVKNSTDGATMISEDQWINLPVGYNLVDHVNTDAVVENPGVVFYDFYQAWTDPNITDALSYLRRRSGILAQAAPNIGPMMWEEIKGRDGIVRQLQWTSRVEASLGVNSTIAMTMSQYLGRGSTSRGRMTISRNLDTLVAEHPYLRDPNDVEAVVTGMQHMRDALAGSVDITWASPVDNITSTAYVAGMVVSPGARRANHWMGTNKLGTDDGRTGGTAVVDLDTKVYGTDNLFVVDASIFPGMVTGNPSAIIVIASEHAADRILALPTPQTGLLGDTCGGKNWRGSMVCAPGLTCRKWTEDVSTCVELTPAQKAAVMADEPAENSIPE